MSLLYGCRWMKNVMSISRDWCTDRLYGSYKDVARHSIQEIFLSLKHCYIVSIPIFYLFQTSIKSHTWNILIRKLIFSSTWFIICLSFLVKWPDFNVIKYSYVSNLLPINRIDLSDIRDSDRRKHLEFHPNTIW